MDREASMDGMTDSDANGGAVSTVKKIRSRQRKVKIIRPHQRKGSLREQTPVIHPRQYSLWPNPSPPITHRSVQEPVKGPGLLDAAAPRNHYKWCRGCRRKLRDYKEKVRYRTFEKHLTVAVFIATITFAAAFTLPGGYRNDSGPEQGTAILTKKAAFKAFIVSDVTGMVGSIIIIHLHTEYLDHDARLRSISASVKLMKVALSGMAVAFATGVYVVTVGECKWLAIFVCVLVCGILLWMHTPLSNLGKVKTYLKEKMAAVFTNDKNSRVKDHQSGASDSDCSISMPPSPPSNGQKRSFSYILCISSFLINTTRCARRNLFERTQLPVWTS